MPSTEPRDSQNDTARAQLAAIVESSDDAIISKSLAGIILSWNRGAERVFGYTAEEAIGQPVLMLIPPGQHDEEPEILRRLQRGEHIHHYETVRRRKDGTLIDVSLSVSPILDASGRVVSAAKIARDITAQKRAQRMSERLLASTVSLGRALEADAVAEATLREGMGALGAASGTFYLLAADGQTFELVHSVGVPDDALEGFRRVSVDAPLPLCDAVRAQALLFHQSNEGLVERYPTMAPGVRRVAAGAWVTVPLCFEARAQGAAVFGFPHGHTLGEEDRRFLGALASQAAQALERARLYEAERAAREEAEAANRAKLDFLATMSHELRTPLNAIAGYAELLQLGLHGPVSVAQQDALGRIQRSQRHLLSLINDLLTFAKIEAGHLEVRLSRLELAPFLAGVEPLVAPQLRAKGIAFAPPRGAAGVSALADEERLRQILLNLLSNAVKYTAAGGSVAVECARDGAGTVTITVRDTGMGIAPEHLELIFDPFVQPNRSLSSGHEGAGLGLAISRELARGMGGDLTVASAPGRGSAFTVRLRDADA